MSKPRGAIPTPGRTVPILPRPRPNTDFNPFDLQHGFLTKNKSGISKMVLQVADSGDGVTQQQVIWLSDEAETNRVLLNEDGIWLKGPGTYLPFGSLVPGHLIVQEGGHHKKLRLTAQRCLGDQVQKRVVSEGIGRRHCEKLCDVLVAPHAGGEPVVNLDRMMRAFALDVISETLFGVSWGAIDEYSPANPKAHALAEVMHELHWRASDNAKRDWITNPTLQPTGTHLHLLNTEVEHEISRRRATPTADMLSSWMEADPTLTDDELKGLCLTFLTMGHENVATSVSWTVLLLAEHPEVQQRVREEVAAATSNGTKHLTWQDLNTKLPLLTAAYHEATRLYPSVPVLTRMPAEDTTLCGYEVKKGDEVVISLYSHHRNKAHWGEDAAVFNPSRYERKGCPRLAATGLPDAAPFGMGFRRCVGQPLSYVEVRLVVAALLQRYKVTAQKKTKPNNFVSLRPGKHSVTFTPLSSNKL